MQLYFLHSVMTRCSVFNFSLFICLICADREIKKTNLIKLHLGSISPTYLRTAFTPVAPKSVRIQSSCQYLFTLLGSTSAKAARRMLMKLTPGSWKHILL